MKRIISLLMIAILMVVFAGCTPKVPAAEPAVEKPIEAKPEAQPDSGGTPDKKYTIGVTMQGLSAIFMQHVLSGIKDRAATQYPNIELICVDSEDSVDKQIGQVENFVSRGCDAVIMSSVDMEGCAPAVTACVEAGIPIVNVNTLTSNQKDAAAYAGTDPVQSGEIQAQYIADLLGGKGNVAYVNGGLGHSVQIGRHQGYDNVFSKYPDINVVFDGAGEWQTDVAMKLMETWLQSGTQIDAVLCHADAMTMGVLAAVENAGMEGKILIAGMDCLEDIMHAIEKGTVTCSVWQDAIGQGAASVDLAVKAIKGEPVADEIIPYTLCTKDNIGEYWKKIEDVAAINDKYTK